MVAFRSVFRVGFLAHPFCSLSRTASWDYFQFARRSGAIVKVSGRINSRGRRPLGEWRPVWRQRGWRSRKQKV